MNANAATLDDFPEVPLLKERRAVPAVPHAESDTSAPSEKRSNPLGESPFQKNPRKRWKLITLGALGIITVSTGIGAYLHHAAMFEETDNAFVEADVHPISSRVYGAVVEVLLDDNQTVTQGQVLVRLDPRDAKVNLQSARAALARAEAQVTQTQAALSQTQAALKQAEAQITANTAQLEKAHLDFSRAKSLFSNAGRAISQQDLDSAKAAYAVAQSSSQAAAAARDAAMAAVRTAEANVTAASAGREQALAVVQNAELQLSYTQIVAPSDGRIAKKTVETGQHIQPGQALMAVVAPGHWIVANFKENQLAEMRPNQEVEIKVDAIRGHAFKGHVDSFAPGTGAKFSLLPPDNATGNFTKIVQRVPVKILLDPSTFAGYDDRIAPGLSAVVSVRVKD